MNGLEKRYAAEILEPKRLAGEILWYEFDAVKLRLAAATFYTPDFFVMKADYSLEVHEVKGTSKGKPFVEDDAAVKIKVAADKFPFRFRMTWLDRKLGWQNRNYE